MDILGLTSFDQIRGVMTVSTADLPNEALAHYGLEEELKDDLFTWLETWEAILAADAREANLLKIYAKYRCAGWVAASGQNFTLKQFTDGANAGQRSDTEGFQELRRHLEGRANLYRKRIEELVNVIQEVPFRAAMGIVNPSRNPVLEGR